jgi:hypothetical protein
VTPSPGGHVSRGRALERGAFGCRRLFSLADLVQYPPMKSHPAARSGPPWRRRFVVPQLAAVGPPSIGRGASVFRPTLVLLALIGLAVPLRAALAQQDLAAARDCTKISADALRLACYDRVLRAGPTDGATPAAVQSGARQNGESARAGRTASTPPEHDVSSPPTIEIPSPHKAPPADARRADTADKSGDLEVNVVDVLRRAQLVDASFVTDDGQVWRQTDGRRVRLPDPPFRAVISSGAFGSHFLSPVGESISVRVTQQRP